MSARAVRLVAAAGGGFLLLAGASALAAQEVTYAGSIQYATGSYVFERRTSGFHLFSGLDARVGRFGASASVPLAFQNGTAVSYAAGIPLPTGGEEHGLMRGRQQRQRVHLPESAATGYELALGDPLLRGSVDVLEGMGLLPSVTFEGW